jgi:hypothetical protein
MNPLVHHLNQLTNRPNPHVRARTRTRELIDSMCPKLRCPWSSRSTPRASVPHDSAIFSSLSHFAKASAIFLVLFNHFTTMSTILLQRTQSFCYNELNYFFYNAQSFFLLLHCWAILHSYSAQPLLFDTMLNYFSLLQYSVIFYCYSAQPFLTL